MSEKVSDNIDLDIPVFTSLPMKIEQQPIEYENNPDISGLKNIDITQLYQLEPFDSNDSKGFSKTSFILIFLVFIILIMTVYYYYPYIIK